MAHPKLAYVYHKLEFENICRRVTYSSSNIQLATTAARGVRVHIEQGQRLRCREQIKN